MIGAHSTMESPEPVSRVTPPRMIMPKMVAQQISNQAAIALWFESTEAVCESDKLVSCNAKSSEF